MWGMIATWSMAADGVAKGAELLKSGKNAGDATETAIRKVEDFPYYKSVGYGGLPNEEMEVELDAAYMETPFPSELWQQSKIMPIRFPLQED